MAGTTRGAGQLEDGLPSSERVYRQLREMILTGELAPYTRLIELHFAERFKVSRTPVREALKRLAAEGLVYADSVRGLVVRAPNPEEIEDVYLVRETLEALSARLAAQRVTPDELRRLRTILETMRQAAADGETVMVVNASTAFHDVISRAARNGTLSRIVKDLSDFVRRFSTDALAGGERVRWMLEEHERILQALEQHDPEEAGRASSTHVRAASSHLLALHIERTIGAPTAGEGSRPRAGEPVDT